MTKKHLNLTLISILILLLVLIFWPRSSDLTATLSLNQPYAITDNLSLTAVFTSPVDSSDQNKIKLKSDPSLDWQLDWQSNSILNITPQENLFPSTPYALTLTHKSQTIATHTFTSSPYNNQEFLEVAKQQTEDDYNTAQIIDGLHQQHPWYTSIPITTPDFRIIYDFDLESFRIRILTASTPEIKQQALKAIESIGADLNKYDHYFIEPTSSFDQLINQ